MIDLDNNTWNLEHNAEKLATRNPRWNNAKNYVHN